MKNRAVCECGKIYYCNNNLVAWFRGLFHFIWTSHKFEWRDRK